MARPYSPLIAAMLVLIFASQNMHSVEIRLIVGPPVMMPLIVIIMGAFVVGFVIATLTRKRRDNVRTMTDVDHEA